MKTDHDFHVEYFPYTTRCSNNSLSKPCRKDEDCAPQWNPKRKITHVYAVFWVYKFAWRAPGGQKVSTVVGKKSEFKIHLSPTMCPCCVFTEHIILRTTSSPFRTHLICGHREGGKPSHKTHPRNVTDSTAHPAILNNTGGDLPNPQNFPNLMGKY